MKAFCTLVVLTSCAGPPPAPVAPRPPQKSLPLDADMPALAARVLARYQATAAAVTGADATCATATTQLLGVRARFTDVVAALAIVQREGRTEALRRELEARATPMDGAARSIVESPLMATCRNDRAFTDALDEY